MVTEASVRGFALAATVVNDRGGVRAEAGLAMSVRDRWLSAAKALQACSQRERARSLAAWTRAPGPVLPAEAAPPLNGRALSALRQQGNRAPLEPGLALHLRRIVGALATASEGDGEAS